MTASPPTLPVELKPIDPLKELGGYLPRNIVRPFLENSIVTIVVLAVLSGAALRRVKAEQIRAGEKGYLTVEAGVATLFRATEVVLGWVIALVPLADPVPQREIAMIWRTTSPNVDLLRALADAFRDLPPAVTGLRRLVPDPVPA